MHRNKLGNTNEVLQKCRRTELNEVSYGIDKLSTEELLPWLLNNRASLLSSLANGKYKAQAVRRVEIPKEGGKARQLGIPTVVDRLVQQSIAQVLSPLYTSKNFIQASHSFKPNKGCYTALKEVVSHLNDQYYYVVDLDLEKFFDTVNHSRLIEILSKKVKDSYT